jgi:integrase
VCAGLRVLRSQMPTVASFAEEWTSGELLRRYPDHVDPKLPISVEHDKRIFRKYINPVIGPRLLHTITLDDVKLVMAKLPGHLTAGRWQVAQVLHHLFNLACWPAEHIQANPIPKGFLPKPQQERDFDYLRPHEEAQLLACTRVPLKRRMVYALCNRTGLRPAEAAALLRGDLGPHLNVIDLTHHKTVRRKGARLFPMDLDVRAALGWWLLHHAPAANDRDPIFPNFKHRNLASQLRRDLVWAGVLRPSLHQSSVGRRRMRAHDLRATFVTLALAMGRTETWVMDRTGHSSSQLLERYKRAARTAAELELGWLAPMWEAIPECAAAYRELLAAGMRPPRGGAGGKVIPLVARGAGGPSDKITYIFYPAVAPQNPHKFGGPPLDSGPRIPAAYPPRDGSDSPSAPVVISSDPAVVCGPFRAALTTTEFARLRRAA